MKKKKIKNVVLKSITVLAFIIFVISACCFDSTYPIPFYIICIVSLLWITVMSYINGGFDY